MEIDLELLSRQEDKLVTRSDINVGHGADELNAGQDDISSGRYSVDSEKSPDINLDAHTATFGNGVGEDALGFTAFVNEARSYELQNGLEFESKEAAYSFYREHARSAGFGITIKASRRSKKTGKFIDVKIACSRFGSKRDSARSCPKTDCKASMHIKRKPDGKWFIFSFVKEHNHELSHDEFYATLKGKSKQSSIIACHKKGLQLALDEVDVQALLDYFMVMQDENSNFFYAFDLDRDTRMRNVLWVDTKSRHEYKFFSDVIFFDSSYVRDKFRVPFVPILGVNHHFQIVLLGCALVGEETAASFAWLMRTWLRAVGGQAPKVIITHELNLLKEAIAEVFPDASHCYWLWHVLRKTLENLGHILNGSENFMLEFKESLFRSWTNLQFENQWSKLVDKFDLRENEWLRELYENREKWVPAYMGDIFVAGFCAAERSECIPSLFSNYVHSDTTLKDFICHYEAFRHDCYEKEAKADFEMLHSPPILRSLSPFEKQMSTVYTPTIFKKFQVEVLGTAACSLQKDCEDGEDLTFRVNDFEDGKDYNVVWNETEMSIRCLCRSFEQNGFLCRHAMIVLQMAGVSSIPSHYILQRWTNTARIRKSTNEISTELCNRSQRLNDLCKRAVNLCEEGSLSQDAYNIVVDVLHESIQRCVGVNHSVKSVSDPGTFAAQVLRINEEEDRSQSQAKPSKKKKSNETHKEQMSSGAHSDENTPIPQQDIQGMEQVHSSLLAIRDGYFGNQQGMLGLLNTIPMGFDHYGPRQSLQGLLQGQLGFRPPTVHTCFNFQDSVPDMVWWWYLSKSLHSCLRTSPLFNFFSPYLRDMGIQDSCGSSSRHSRYTLLTEVVAKFMKREILG